MRASKYCNIEIAIH